MEIKHKYNIYSELNMILKSIKQLLLGISHTPKMNHDIPVYHIGKDTVTEVTEKRAKFFYNHLVDQKRLRPHTEQKWNTIFGKEVDFDIAYRNKIQDIRDYKIAETNFKILHRILPCGINLVKWKKKDTAACDVCGREETIQHLLFECAYTNDIWKLVGKALSTELNSNNVILVIGLSEKDNFITSLIAYLIFKEWVHTSLDNRKREKQLSYKKYLNELTCYRNVY